jgi:hypothetical protein
LKRKIFQGRCPWNGKKLMIYIDEEKWEELIFKFDLKTDLKLITKRWWQTENCLDYFLRKFLKIDTLKPLTLAEYDLVKNLIVIYPETVILVFKVKDQDDLKKKLALRLAHEFKHAIDREKLKQMWIDAANIPSPKERKLFLEKTKKNFEDMAKEFAKNFSFLFSDIIEIEIK